jgi:hypothetical protein
MPRRGKGQQATQTASGQAYGEAKAQEEAQAAVPLPQNVMKPGELRFNRPTELPNQSILAEASNPSMNVPKDEYRQAKAASVLPVLEAMASMPHADPAIRNLARVVRSMVGDASEVGSPIRITEDE